MGRVMDNGFDDFIAHCLHFFACEAHETVYKKKTKLKISFPGVSLPYLHKKLILVWRFGSIGVKTGMIFIVRTDEMKTGYFLTV